MKDNMMYHSTNKKNENNILKNGLLINKRDGFTDGGSWSHEVYGMSPIFLSINNKRFTDENSISFMVDTSKLKLVADLPSLIDFGAHLEEIGDDYLMWWHEGEEPGALSEYLQNNEVYASDFLANKNLINAAIKVTGTAAVMNNIPPELISRVLTEKLSIRKLRSLIKASSTYYGKAGAGVLIICKEDQTCLLLKRSSGVEQPGTWGISGGAISDGERYYDKNDIKEEDANLDFKETAFRESDEELFSKGSFSINSIEKEEIGKTEFKDGNFRYVTFVYGVSLKTKKEITSKISLNWENDAAKWFALDSLPGNLHFGVEFTKKSLSEQEINIFKDQKDELDWLVNDLEEVRKGSKNNVWNIIFENLGKIIRQKKGNNVYEMIKQQEKETYDFILNSSKELLSAGEQKAARQVFHMASKFKLTIKGDQDKNLEKIPNREVSQNDGFLYHGTNFENAISVLAAGKFLAFGAFTRLCLTSDLPMTGKFGDVVFVFDAKKLQRKGAKKMNYDNEKIRKEHSPEINENWIKNPWISDVYKREKEWIVKLPFEFTKEDLVKVIVFKSSYDEDGSAKLFFDYILENNKILNNVDVEIKNYPSYGKTSPRISDKTTINTSNFMIRKELMEDIGMSRLSIESAMELYQKLSKEYLKIEANEKQYDFIYISLYSLVSKINDISSYIKKSNISGDYDISYVLEQIGIINSQINKFYEKINSSDTYGSMSYYNSGESPSRLYYYYGEDWKDKFLPVFKLIFGAHLEGDGDGTSIKERFIRAGTNFEQKNKESKREEVLKMSDNDIIFAYFETDTIRKLMKYDAIKSWCIENFEKIKSIENLNKILTDTYSSWFDNKKTYKKLEDIIMNASYKFHTLVNYVSHEKVPNKTYADYLYSLIDSDYLTKISDQRIKSIISIVSKTEVTASIIMNDRYKYLYDQNKKCKLIIIARELAKKKGEIYDFEEIGISDVNSVSCD